MNFLSFSGPGFGMDFDRFFYRVLDLILHHFCHEWMKNQSIFETRFLHFFFGGGR